MPPTLAVDDVLAVEYPGPPAWSADGRRVAVAVYEDDGRSLRVAPADAAAPAGRAWRWRPDAGHVAAFAWAPEATPTLLAVVTDAGELHLADAANRTTERRSDHVDADDLAWAADGRRLAVYRDGRPAVVDVESGADRRFDVPGRGGFLGEERMLAWGPDDRLLAYRFVAADTKQVGVVDVETGDLVWRTREREFATSSPAWLGDGRLLVDRVGRAGTVREVAAVAVPGGDESVLYRETDREHGVVSSGAPTVSPDGDRVAMALPEGGWEHVHVVDAATGTRTRLTEGPFEDKGLADSRPQWLDRRTLVFASNREDPGWRGLYAVDLDGRTTPLATGVGTRVHPRPSPDGERLAYLSAGRDHSPELRLADLDSAEDADERADPDTDRATARRSVTRSAVRDWPVEPVEPESVTYESVDGREIHAYLLDPRETEAVADDAADLPAVVWVHGGPMRQMRDGWHPTRAYGLAYSFQQYLAHRGFVGLLVNYRGGVGYGREFRQSLAGARGDLEMADVVAGADHLRSLDHVDADAVGTWGLSYGGYAALQILGTRPEAFDVAVNLAGLADLEQYRDWAAETKYPACVSSLAVRLGGEPWEAPAAWAEASPVTHVDEFERPLYSFHGTADRYVDFEQLDLVVEELLARGAHHEWEHYPDETHVFSKRATWERTLAKIEDAFDEHLRH